jgi:anti-sigma regulatory factor (Ser/Thr protein kinase)
LTVFLSGLGKRPARPAGRVPTTETVCPAVSGPFAINLPTGVLQGWMRSPGTMTGLKKTFRIKAKDFIHAGEASISVQNLLKSLDLDPQTIRRIAICGYEGEMNVVMHGGDGELSIEIDANTLAMDISDNGPGIDDIEKAMEAGFSTASDEHREMGFGAGMGLPNMKKNSDTITVESTQGQGTRVRMVFHLS